MDFSESATVWSGAVSFVFPPKSQQHRRRLSVISKYLVSKRD